MLNSLISAKVTAWFRREDCPVRQVIEHIVKAGFLRDAQIEAIKTYLFLKIEGGNRPLGELFAEGFFSPQEDLATLHISQATRLLFESDPAARALYAFTRVKTNGAGKTLLPGLETFLRDHAAEVDCRDIIKRLFYGVEYPDYLFSLPMGAGKTFLMAAFLYLDLYFAQNEPGNRAFAHNFLLLVPSGLKSSIIPSLKTIEKFDPAWVLPEPAATNIRKLVRFEILDQPKSGSRSNRARNPNAQKVSQYQPFEALMGLVMVTNAEKVVLDQAKFDAQLHLIEPTEDEKDKAANELRNLIGKIPNLQILIDEVHHAATDEIKLRQVVNQWQKGNSASQGNINGVLGFSGTPYLSSAEEVKVADKVAVKFAQITNTVFYYPLTRAIEGFLKQPTVRVIRELESQRIVRHGVTEFLAEYGGKTYANGVTAKLAIYCGSIERLEEEIYPLLIGEMGIAPDDILKYHRGNAKYKISAKDEAEWKFLDTPLSRKRVILLVQIGKEGWDCRSLTGVILSQKGDCPTNMALQTSCRCLREMDGKTDGNKETAGIWLNADNAASLDKQLKEEQHTSIEEINRIGSGNAPPTRPRYNRMAALQLPPVDFYQLRVCYNTLTTEATDPQASLRGVNPARFRANASSLTRSLTGSDIRSQFFHAQEQGESADFSAWLLFLAKSSLNTLKVSDLREYEPQLRAIFDAITFREEEKEKRRRGEEERRGLPNTQYPTPNTFFDALYDAEAIAAEIRLAFYARRELNSEDETIPVAARLLMVETLAGIAADKKNVYPSEAEVEQMRTMDAAGQTAYQYAQEQRAKMEQLREMAKAANVDINLFALRDADDSSATQNKDRSFHYAPYTLDSGFELEFLKQALTLQALRDGGLELYFNGAGELTEFRVDCYAPKTNGGWSRVGKYTPDFLLVERQNGRIHRALIIETKGSGYADQKAFIARRRFVETEFLKMNNAKFGYARFDYLYLSDADDMQANLRKLCDAAATFFTDKAIHAC